MTGLHRLRHRPPRADFPCRAGPAHRRRRGRRWRGASYRASRPSSRQTPGSIAFLANRKYRPQLASTRASAVIVAPDMTGDTSLPSSSTPIRMRSSPRSRRSCTPARRPGGRASFGSRRSDREGRATAAVAALAVIGAGVVIGERASIGAGTIIGADALVGEDATLHAAWSSTIAAWWSAQHPAFGCGDRRRRLRHGRGGRPLAQDSAGRPRGDRRRRGDRRNTTIDRGAIDDTVIEDDVKLDNQIQIGHNCRIGRHISVNSMTCARRPTKNINATCRLLGARQLLVTSSPAIYAQSTAHPATSTPSSNAFPIAARIAHPTGPVYDAIEGSKAEGSLLGLEMIRDLENSWKGPA